MFVKVPYTQLEEGKKYKIHGYCNTYAAIYRGRNQDPYCNLMFSKRKHKLLFSSYEVYYEFVSKARETMERRAVSMIVRRLIGDECFEW
jgi:hypothetical protein